jgi:hypothetical protein
MQTPSILPTQNRKEWPIQKEKLINSIVPDGNCQNYQRKTYKQGSDDKKRHGDGQKNV